MIGTTFIDLTLFMYFPEAVKSAKLKKQEKHLQLVQ